MSSYADTHSSITVWTKCCFALASSMFVLTTTQLALAGRAGVRVPARWLPVSRSFCAGSKVLEFGIHKGWTFAECLERDMDYCTWAMSFDDTPNRPGVLGFVSFLNAAGVRPRMLSEDAISFGKYIGRSYKDIFKEDPSYCDWILNFSYGPDSTVHFRHFADWITHRHPQFAAKAAARGLDLSPWIRYSEEAVTFGKYQGRAYEAIFVGDRPYCKWILRASCEPVTTSSCRHFASWIWRRDPEFAARVEVRRS